MTDLNEFSSDISTKMTCQGKLEEQPETDEDLRTRNNTSTLDESLECNLEEIESSVKTVKLELDCAYDDIKKDLPEVKKEVISQVIDKTNQLMENTSKVIMKAKTTKSQFQFLRELIENQEKKFSEEFKSQKKELDELKSQEQKLSEELKSQEQKFSEELKSQEQIFSEELKSQEQKFSEELKSQEQKFSEELKSQKGEFQMKIDGLVNENKGFKDQLKIEQIHNQKLHESIKSLEKQLLPLLSRESLECFIHHILNIGEKHQNVSGLSSKLYFKMIGLIQEHVKKISKIRNNPNNKNIEKEDIFPSRTYNVFVQNTNGNETSDKIEIPANPNFPWDRFYKWISQKLECQDNLTQKIVQSFFDINHKTYSEELIKEKEVVEVEQSMSWRKQKPPVEKEVHLYKAYSKFLHPTNVFFDMNFEDIPEGVGKLILILIHDFFKQDIELKKMYALYESEKLNQNTSNNQTNLDNTINIDKTVNVFNSSNLTHFKNSNNTIEIDIACEANNSISNKTPDVKDQNNSEDA